MSGVVKQTQYLRDDRWWVAGSLSIVDCDLDCRMTRMGRARKAGLGRGQIDLDRR